MCTEVPPVTLTSIDPSFAPLQVILKPFFREMDIRPNAVGSVMVKLFQCYMNFDLSLQLCKFLVPIQFDLHHQTKPEPSSVVQL